MGLIKWKAINFLFSFEADLMYLSARLHVYANFLLFARVCWADFPIKNWYGSHVENLICQAAAAVAAALFQKDGSGWWL